MTKTLIIYPKLQTEEICPDFREEAVLMRKMGFRINTKCTNAYSRSLYRGYMMTDRRQYPTDSRLIQNWDEYYRTLYMSEFYPIIAPYAIPTFFVNNLKESELIPEIKKRGWERVFIKSEFRSLFTEGLFASVWPDTPIKEIALKYAKKGWTGPFAIRKYIDNQHIFYDEQRYWVLNGIAYHPSKVIPPIVAEAAKRIYKFSGSHYFTIDVAGDYIVEINPGESSDRGGDNPLEFFCKIFAETFLKE